MQEKRVPVVPEHSAQCTNHSTESHPLGGGRPGDPLIDPFDIVVDGLVLIVRDVWFRALVELPTLKDPADLLKRLEALQRALNCLNTASLINARFEKPSPPATLNTCALPESSTEFFSLIDRIENPESCAATSPVGSSSSPTPPPRTSCSASQSPSPTPPDFSLTTANPSHGSSAAESQSTPAESLT